MTSQEIREQVSSMVIWMADATIHQARRAVAGKTGWDDVKRNPYNLPEVEMAGQVLFTLFDTFPAAIMSALLEMPESCDGVHDHEGCLYFDTFVEALAKHQPIQLRSSDWVLERRCGTTGNGSNAELKEQLATVEQEKIALKWTLKRSNPTGTHMAQEDYLTLEKSAESLVGHCDVSTVLSDDEAKVLINQEFNFEVSRIKILHEAEIDVTPENSKYIKIENTPRKPVYSSSDWNYIRFNVHAAPAVWYYEMVNGFLHQVSI